MAIWQFTFHLVPRETVEQLHGPAAITLAAFRGVDLETDDENAEWPNYWAGRSPRSYAEAVKAGTASEVMEPERPHVWR
jgi:hypothetical protein